MQRNIAHLFGWKLEMSTWTRFGLNQTESGYQLTCFGLYISSAGASWKRTLCTLVPQLPSTLQANLGKCLAIHMSFSQATLKELWLSGSSGHLSLLEQVRAWALWRIPASARLLVRMRRGNRVTFQMSCFRRMMPRQHEYVFSHTFEQPIQPDPKLIQAKP
jgi:hypothetical protein